MSDLFVGFLLPNCFIAVRAESSAYCLITTPANLFEWQFYWSDSDWNQFDATRKKKQLSCSKLLLCVWPLKSFQACQTSDKHDQTCSPQQTHSHVHTLRCLPLVDCFRRLGGGRWGGHWWHFSLSASTFFTLFCFNLFCTHWWRELCENQ